MKVSNSVRISFIFDVCVYSIQHSLPLFSLMRTEMEKKIVYMKSSSHFALPFSSSFPCFWSLRLTVMVVAVVVYVLVKTKFGFIWLILYTLCFCMLFFVHHARLLSHQTFGIIIRWINRNNNNNENAEVFIKVIILVVRFIYKNVITCNVTY